MSRKRRGLVGGVVLLLLLAGASLWFLRLRNGPGARSGDFEVAGLSGPVEVLTDSLGIPQIWATTIDDALFAQGYLHASDRLWQMEQLRRVASGRLSELLGVPAIDSDKFLRTLGMSRAAERGRELLCEQCKQRLDAYVAGVNAALEGWSGPLPPELFALDVTPDPWTDVDALAIEKIMAWDLAEYDVGLLLADARRRGGEKAFEAVRPRYPEDGLDILEDIAAAPSTGPRRTAAASPDAPAPRDPSPVLSAELIASAQIPELARSFLDASSALRASNAWVVGGARTTSGKPIVANDMHLGLNAPTIFYLMGLHAPGLDVVGMTIPGSPGVVAGHSGAVAWGFSNAGVDDVDLFLERADSTDPARYLTPGGSEPFQVRREEIRVRGLAEPVALEIKETRHGPIISGIEARAGSDLLALRWIGHDPSPSLEAILAMNTSRSAADFVEALRQFRDPHQNVVFADTAGAFGYWLAGRIPLRKSGHPPLLPVIGWTGENDWEGDLPFEDHPHVLNPARGFVVTANNRQTSGPVSALVTDQTWTLPYRAGRITALLDSLGPVDAAANERIQLDLISPFALRYRMTAATAYREAGEVARADSLAAWDGSTATDRREPVLFYAWLELVRYRVAREMYGGPPGYFPTSVLERMLEAGQVNPSTTTAPVREAVANAAEHRWGDAHLLHLDHPLAPVKVVGRLFGFGRVGIPLAGDPYTVGAMAHSGRFPPFQVNHGPSQRHVVDLGDLDGAGGFILPGGQSGFPGSRHAFDQLPRWLSGGLVPIPITRERAEARTVDRFRLVPR